MQSPSPGTILRTLQPLEADLIIKIALTSCKKLPLDLQDKLIRHGHDESVSNDLNIRVEAGSHQHHVSDSNLPPYMVEAMNFHRDTMFQKDHPASSSSSL
ncbi:hypothetical protein DFQ28_006257 [Apophysomyces sp. BC1034]|nr:hypothetical protein DFQ30_004401 [Apophysomyces sp. BC1015]KAG0180433.1 hypothetical protein DFQ29_000679 [Apophysomyces sp. BC1021]KAG0187502.1 hypothetical protein DFQ28_006257 [Apophysomyces sp. BC1034]